MGDCDGTGVGVIEDVGLADDGDIDGVLEGVGVLVTLGVGEVVGVSLGVDVPLKLGVGV